MGNFRKKFLSLRCWLHSLQIFMLYEPHLQCHMISNIHHPHVPPHFLKFCNLYNGIREPCGRYLCDDGHIEGMIWCYTWAVHRPSYRTALYIAKITMKVVIKKRRILISTISLLDNDSRRNVIILTIIGQS